MDRTIIGNTGIREVVIMIDLMSGEAEYGVLSHGTVEKMLQP